MKWEPVIQSLDEIERRLRNHDVIAGEAAERAAKLALRWTRNDRAVGRVVASAPDDLVRAAHIKRAS